jgi:hypothetical protein
MTWAPSPVRHGDKENTRRLDAIGDPERDDLQAQDPQAVKRLDEQGRELR